MEKRSSWAAVASVVAMSCVVVACGGDGGADGGMGCGDGASCVIDAGVPDAPAEDAGGADAGATDADVDGGDAEPPGACDFTVVARNLGSACESNACVDPLTCQSTMPGALPSVNPDGSAGPNLTATIFPNGGECTVSCNLSDPGEACGECGACRGVRIGTFDMPLSVDADGNAFGVCRPFCTPSRTDNGGCREGYTCAVESGACVEACVDDMQCRFRVGASGELVFLADYPSTCNTTTGRCEVAGNDSAVYGGPCDDDLDCPDDGFCITGEGWTGGYCSRVGCDHPGFECEGDAVCDVRSFGQSVCLRSCDVGQEPVADRTGATGHGAGCAVGFACVWDGTSAPDGSPNGGCVAGEYNDMAVSSVGAPCQTAADCHSPFGYARCFFEHGDADGDRTDSGELNSGMCSVAGCATFMDATGTTVQGILPGIGDTAGSHTICDPAAGELCVNFGNPGDPPTTYCMKQCTSASECAPGYACPEILPSGGRVCWAYCETSSDCRTGQSCLDDTGGACDPATEACYCSPGCSADADCATVPGAPECAGGRCRACDPADDSGCAGATPQCNPADHTCVGCLVDTDCTDPTLNRCNALGGNVCVDCLTGADCASGTCTANVCAPIP